METLHEGCGGAGLVESGVSGGGEGGGGQADIRAKGDFGGQTSNQVCSCGHQHKIFGCFFSELVHLRLGLLVIVVE